MNNTVKAPKTPRGIRINPNISETHIPGPVAVEHIPIAEINRDPTIQQRAGGMSTALVSEYAENIGEWIERAPLTVYRDDGFAWIYLADGFHRAEAAALAGLQSVPCVVHPGGYRAALLCACGANAAHGARRTREDRRRAVETLLKDPEWSCWSDRRIAETAGVSPTTVGILRAQLSNLDSCQRPGTHTTVVAATPEDQGAMDTSPVMAAAPNDTAAPNLSPPISETAPDPKRIGRDGKARAAPAPKESETVKDTDPGYRKKHAVTAEKLFKKAECLTIAIKGGESLDVTLRIMVDAISFADGLYDDLLGLRDQRDRAQANAEDRAS